MGRSILAIRETTHKKQTHILLNFKPSVKKPRASKKGRGLVKLIKIDDLESFTIFLIFIFFNARVLPLLVASRFMLCSVQRGLG